MDKQSKIMQSTKKHATSLLLLFFTISTRCFAFDIESNGIYYNILNENEVEVTNKYSLHYSGVVSIPSFVEFNKKQYKVTGIGYYAFDECTNLTSITISKNVTYIGESAFRKCSGLSSINLPNGIDSIGKYAFYGCTGLTEITLPDKIKVIGESTFYRCKKLESIEIGNNVETIVRDAFGECESLSSLVIPNSVRTIGEGCFYGCKKLESISIGSGVTSIESTFRDCVNLKYVKIVGNKFVVSHYLFWNCNSPDLSVELGDGVVDIEDRAFAACKGLSSIIIGSSVSRIGSHVFDGCCALKKVEINSSIGSIGEYAFNGCSVLYSITIPSSVLTIGQYAFSCSGLSSFISKIENPFAIPDNVFYEISSDAVLLVPKGTKENYAVISGWSKNFKEIKEENKGAGGNTCV